MFTLFHKSRAHLMMTERKRVPTHIAIIMDGNGRWAKKRGLPRTEGHRKGMKVVKETIKSAQELGVRYLTLYAFSTENWKRPKEEVDFLMHMCQEMISRELTFMIKNDIRLLHIGRKDGLSDSLQSCIRNAEKLTENNRRLCVQLAFNYGSRLEILDAVKQIAEEVHAGRLSLEGITEEIVSDHLYTRRIPDPDLLIRTSGELRVSNFLLWQICYTEIYVTRKMWPDFSKRELMRSIEDYRKRSRRFGGVDD
jgi:undecaprenyl diphosphate synthase